MMLTMYQSQKGQQDQAPQPCRTNATAMGQAFDAFQERRFVLSAAGGLQPTPISMRGMKMFVSHPMARPFVFIIFPRKGDPATAEGISHIDAIRNAAFEAIKGTPLEGSKDLPGWHRGGRTRTWQRGAPNLRPLLIAGISSLCLDFSSSWLILTRAVIASLVIVGTVLLSTRCVPSASRC